MSARPKWSRTLPNAMALLLIVPALILAGCGKSKTASADAPPAANNAQTNAANSNAAAPAAGQANSAAGQDRQAAFNLDVNTPLAKTLGITPDQLQTVEQQAMDAALKQAVTAGQMTQQQADAQRARGTGQMTAFGRFGNRGLDYQTSLATALNVSVADLTAAEESAWKAALDQAVADGKIPQDRANLMEAERAFQTYEATQRQAGQGQSTQGQPAYADRVGQALTAGAITQAQADLLKANPPTNGGFRRQGNANAQGGNGGGQGQGNTTTP